MSLKSFFLAHFSIVRAEEQREDVPTTEKPAQKRGFYQRLKKTLQERGIREVQPENSSVEGRHKRSRCALRPQPGFSESKAGCSGAASRPMHSRGAPRNGKVAASGRAGADERCVCGPRGRTKAVEPKVLPPVRRSDAPGLAETPRVRWEIPPNSRSRLRGRRKRKALTRSHSSVKASWERRADPETRTTKRGTKLRDPLIGMAARGLRLAARSGNC